MPHRAEMNHFVAYHNTEKMKCPLHFHSDFRFHTNKSQTLLEKSIGACLWIITGAYEGKRLKTFRLLAFYTPTEVLPSDRGSLKFQVVGKDGKEFSDPPIINECEWFPELIKCLGNFRFGIQELNSRGVISGLTVLEQASS